jgi:hypothetical protein
MHARRQLMDANAVQKKRQLVNFPRLHAPVEAVTSDCISEAMAQSYAINPAM